MEKKSKLKIAIVWEQYEWGGVDSYLAYLLNDWPEQSDYFLIFHNSQNSGVKRLKKLLNGNVKVEFIKITPLFRRYHNQKFLKVFQHTLTPIIFLLNSYIYKIRLNKHAVDIVMAQNGGYPGSYGNIASIFGAYWAKKRARMLVIHHAAIKPLPMHGFFRLVMERCIAKITTSIITVSNATKETLRINTALMDTQECNVVTIANGIYCCPVFIDKKLINKNNIKICILGRLESYKGHDIVIGAISQLLVDGYKNFTVDFIGGYSKLDYLKLKHLISEFNLEKYINILGYIDGTVEEILINYDLLLMATKTFEGFGLTILEAMNMGVSVIASKVGIAAEIFPEGSINLVEPGNILSMYKALCIFVNKETRYKFNEIKTNEILEKFNSKNMANSYRIQFLMDMAKN